MRAVTLHAFGVTVYGNNDNMEKKRQKKKKQIQKGYISSFFIITVFVVKNVEFRLM